MSERTRTPGLGHIPALPAAVEVRPWETIAKPDLHPDRNYRDVLPTLLPTRWIAAGRTHRGEPDPTDSARRPSAILHVGLGHLAPENSLGKIR